MDPRAQVRRPDEGDGDEREGDEGADETLTSRAESQASLCLCFT